MVTTGTDTQPVRSSKPWEGDASSPREVRFLCSAEGNAATEADGTGLPPSREPHRIGALTKLRPRSAVDLTPAQLARFESKVDRTGACHLWTAHVQSRGYGELTVNQKKHLAHRLAWELANGPIPGDLTIDHVCTVKRCVRVEHLELVTRRENTLRRDQRREVSP